MQLGIFNGGIALYCSYSEDIVYNVRDCKRSAFGDDNQSIAVFYPTGENTAPGEATVFFLS